MKKKVFLNFVFYFFKKLGRSGDGKRNILCGWPYLIAGIRASGISIPLSLLMLLD